MMRRLLPGLALLVAVGVFVPRATATGPDADAGFASPYMVNIGAQVPGPQWTVDSYEQHFANAESAGLKAAFVPVAWSDIEKVPGSYDWFGLDPVVESACNHHLDLVLQVQSTGEWAVPTPAQNLATGGRRTNSMHPAPNTVTAAPMNIDAALPFWQALAGRYRPGGDLSSQLGHCGVRYYEAENEPDFSPWPSGGWETVTKDYALYVSHVSGLLKSFHPPLELVGPALSGVDSNGTSPIANTGLDWLNSLLSSDPATSEWGSDQYRAGLTPGDVPIGAGPSLDVYSYHCDFANGAAGALATRATAVRDVITKYADQPRYPTTATPRLWCSEGAATSYDTSDDSKKYRFAWAQMQFAAELLGAGVERFNFDLGIQGGDSGTTWQADPIRPAGLAMSTYFPSGTGVVPVAVAAPADEPVQAYRWTNPNNKMTSTIVWPDNAASGTTGTPFTVEVPVTTPTAEVVDPNTWAQHTVSATNGLVEITVTPADPSAPWIVADVAG